jgi:hypothetical protein
VFRMLASDATPIRQKRGRIHYCLPAAALPSVPVAGRPHNANN